MNVLVIGGAGFIGSNVVERFARKGATVFVLDDLSRAGAVLNLSYLKHKFPSIKFFHCNIRFRDDVLRIFQKQSFDVVFHLAAQVAVTTSVVNPREDFEIEEKDRRYQYRDYPDGIAEDMPLDFHSPYGCSKGAADQYIIDYSRIYGLKTVVFRQSCIYGYRQFGIEDQGWVAWFTIA